MLADTGRAEEERVRDVNDTYMCIYMEIYIYMPVCKCHIYYENLKKVKIKFKTFLN